MSSLESVLNGIERRIRIISLAYRLGFYKFQYKGKSYWISQEGDKIELSCSDERIYLGMDERCLRDIAKHFSLFWYVSEEAKKCLEEELNAYEKEKELLAIFLLEDKVSTKK